MAGQKDAFSVMADRWNQWDLAKSRYLWLPVRFTADGFEVPWQDAWDPATLGK